MLAVTVAAVGLAACDGGSTAPPTSTSTTGAPTPQTPPPSETTAPTTPTQGPTSAGCAPTGETVPEDAARAPTVDLDGDGDGAADTLWLSAGLPRVLGVETASGAVLSVEFSSGAPQAARAMAQRLGDGSAIILLDTGRAVPLYAVVGCAVVATQNVDGEQYTFDRGFTGFGTGVACEDTGNGLRLYGVNAVGRGPGGGDVDVTRTLIELHDGGRTATNGLSETAASGLASDDPAVQAAHLVTCGDAPPPVTEPQ